MLFSRKKIIPLIILLFFSIRAYSEIGISRPLCKNEICDTINIDECFITINGEQFIIDTIVQEEINGLFSIIRVEPLYPNYCMLYVSRTDTFYTIYDSIIVKGSLLYLVDTSYSTKIYNVLVEDKEEIKGSLQYLVDFYLSDEKKEDNNYKTTPLCLRRFYNIGKMSKAYKKSDDKDNVARTVSCETCQVIILHGKEEIIYDCPLYNSMYRLK